MPAHAGDPSQFSKDQLKSVLISHNVPLPQGDHRKAVYLQLYLKHILPKDKEAADFSSDDEDMLSENDLLPVGDHKENRRDKMDVRSLSNSELKEQLLKRGVNPGPVLPSTRIFYEKKLQQLLEQVQIQENGAGHEDQYSDSEDEGYQQKNQVETRSEVNEDRGDGAVNGINYSQVNVFTVNVPVPRRSSLPSGSTTRPPAGPYTHIPASLAAEFNQNLATLGDNFSVSKMLKQEKDAALDDFSELLSQSALGMSATRRKPIKGAAGRPIQFRYDDIATRARMQEQTKDVVTEIKAQRLISVPLQIAIFILVAFIALVILTMESSPENPFKPLTEDVELQQP
ncbi:LEM domain-containing protein 1 isoform X6 [Mixophyes fleayi]|uniref:LEM domain-containing protein 1 isoform X6 n=1 Tax=Mixophyes fleayi TaxID=3061075 RepID=UPI003F4E375B